MSDLAEFLLARIAEDEAVAQDVWNPGEWSSGAPAPEGFAYSVVMSSLGRVARLTDSGNASHVARFDPARVLAECEAKRRIVAEQKRWRDNPPGVGLGWAMKHLATPYADHPDYREEWKP